MLLLTTTAQVQRVCEYCPRSHSQQGTELKFQLKSVWSQKLGSCYCKLISGCPKHKRVSAQYGKWERMLVTMCDLAWGRGRKDFTEHPHEIGMVGEWWLYTGLSIPVCISRLLSLYVCIYCLVSQLLSSPNKNITSLCTVSGDYNWIHLAGAGSWLVNHKSTLKQENNLDNKI